MTAENASNSPGQAIGCIRQQQELRLHFDLHSQVFHFGPRLILQALYFKHTGSVVVQEQDAA